MLLGAGRTPITNTGQCEVEMECQGNVTDQTIFVVEGLQTALLGRPAFVLPHLYELNTTGIPLIELVPE